MNKIFAAVLVLLALLSGSAVAQPQPDYNPLDLNAAGPFTGTEKITMWQGALPLVAGTTNQMLAFVEGQPRIV